MCWCVKVIWSVLLVYEGDLVCVIYGGIVLCMVELYVIMAILLSTMLFHLLHHMHMVYAYFTESRASNIRPSFIIFLLKLPLTQSYYHPHPFY